MRYNKVYSKDNQHTGNNNFRYIFHDQYFISFF